MKEQIITEKEEWVIAMQEGGRLRITVPSEEATCVYIQLVNGKLVIVGGASIIENIAGIGMQDKVL